MLKSGVQRPKSRTIRGQATVELALVAMFLALLLVGVADVARIFSEHLDAVHAAGVAARWATLNPNDRPHDPPYDSVQHVVEADLHGALPGPTAICFDTGSDSLQVTVTYNHNFLFGLIKDVPANFTTSATMPGTFVQATGTPVCTLLPTPTATATPIPSDTPTSVPSDTPTSVPSDTPTSVPSATSTEIPSATSTQIPPATSTAAPSATGTPTPLVTPTATPTCSVPHSFINASICRVDGSQRDEPWDAFVHVDGFQPGDGVEVRRCDGSPFACKDPLPMQCIAGDCSFHSDRHIFDAAPEDYVIFILVPGPNSCPIADLQVGPFGTNICPSP